MLSSSGRCVSSSLAAPPYMGCCGIIPDTLPLLQCLYTHRLAFLGNTLDTGLGDPGLQGDYSRSSCADPIGGSAIATANCITMQDAVFCWVFSAHRAHLALAAALCYSHFYTTWPCGCTCRLPGKTTSTPVQIYWWLMGLPVPQS